MVTGTYKSHVRSADRRGTWSFSQRGRSEGGVSGRVKEGSGGGSKGGQRKSPGQRGSRKGGPKGGNVKKKKERDSRRKMILMKNQFQKESTE